jgi:dCMP deaminase
MGSFGIVPLDVFVKEHDDIMYGTIPDTPFTTTFGSKNSSSLRALNDVVNVHILNSFESIPELRAHLDALNLLDPEHLRPGWDTYFMVVSSCYSRVLLRYLTGMIQTLASLASRRSNCMKRRVGAIIVQNNRIVSTGSVLPPFPR